MKNKKAKKKPKTSNPKPFKQMRESFCLHYVETGNGALSAGEAGYSLKSARVTASRLLTNANVQARIAELRKKAEDATIASVIEREQVLTEIIRGRAVQYIKGNRISVSPDSLNSAAVQEITTSEVKIGRGDDAEILEITKLKLRDPVGAITELNKMTKVYSDSPQINIDNRKVEINVVSPKGEELVKQLIDGGGMAIEGKKAGE